MSGGACPRLSNRLERGTAGPEAFQLMGRAGLVPARLMIWSAEDKESRSGEGKCLHRGRGVYGASPVKTLPLEADSIMPCLLEGVSPDSRHGQEEELVFVIIISVIQGVLMRPVGISESGLYQGRVFRNRK